MLKKTIEYTDYDGNQRKEDFYFNLTKAELTEMNFSTKGGFEKWIMKIINAQDSKEIIGVFKEIILKSYGEKSLDGRRFIKNDELRESFAQTEAYSQLFMELATDDVKAAEFINGIIPAELAAEMAKQEAESNIVPMI